MNSFTGFTLQNTQQSHPATTPALTSEQHEQTEHMEVAISFRELLEKVTKNGQPEDHTLQNSKAPPNASIKDTESESPAETEANPPIFSLNEDGAETVNASGDDALEIDRFGIVDSATIQVSADGTSTNVGVPSKFLKTQEAAAESSSHDAFDVPSTIITNERLSVRTLDNERSNADAVIPDRRSTVVVAGSSNKPAFAPHHISTPEHGSQMNVISASVQPIDLKNGVETNIFQHSARTNLDAADRTLVSVKYEGYHPASLTGHGPNTATSDLPNVENSIQNKSVIADSSFSNNTAQMLPFDLDSSISQFSTEKLMPFASSQSQVMQIAQPQTSGLTTPPSTYATAVNNSSKITDAVITLRDTGGNIDVSLSPEELGQLNIKVDHTAGGTQVTFTAERLETQEIMRRQIEHLQTQLKNMGLDNLSFAFGQENTRQAFDQDFEAQDHTIESAFQEEKVSTILLTPSASGLDIRI